MTDLMTAIAMLCQIHSNESSTAIDRQQAACQAFYAKCTAFARPMKSLGECVVERAEALK